MDTPRPYNHLFPQLFKADALPVPLLRQVYVGWRRHHLENLQFETLRMLFFRLILRSIWARFPAYLLGLSGPRGRFRCSVVAFFRGPHRPCAKTFPVPPGGRHRGAGKSLEGRFWSAFLVLHRGCKSGRFAAEGGRFYSHEALQRGPRESSKPW